MTGKTLKQLPLKLGRRVDKGGLDPIPRNISRKTTSPPEEMVGFDLWNAYEVSFLLPSGQPVVFHMQLQYNADTPNIVESKSFKLYLNGMNNLIFENLAAFQTRISRDLNACVQGQVHLSFFSKDRSPAPLGLQGHCLDELALTRVPKHYAATHLVATGSDGSFCFHSHLLRTLCPVTQQPDWGSVVVLGEGAKQPRPESLLAYLLGFRNHPDFHETCCEAIFTDLFLLLAPTRLQVICRYTRRGGLDINPVRATAGFGPAQISGGWRQ